MLTVWVRVILCACLHVHLDDHPFVIFEQSLVVISIGGLWRQVSRRGGVLVRANLQEENFNVSITNVLDLMNTGRHHHRVAGLHLCLHGGCTCSALDDRAARPSGPSSKSCAPVCNPSGCHWCCCLTTRHYLRSPCCVCVPC